MRVLIVAKTRMGKGACIGAITETGESVRLIPFNADPHDGANREYEIGDIWEITAEPETSLISPHNENIVVHKKSRLHPAKDAKDLVSAIELLMPPKTGHPRELYDGLLQNTENGRLHIAKQSGIPTHSTTFWRPDMPLTLDIEKQRPRYRYPTENGGCTFTFGGFQEPLETIPTDTLLRVSLAHWWRPEDRPEVEERCYAQISGWFLEEEIQEKQKPFREEKLPPSQTLTQSPLEILQNVFGHEEFRPFQEEIIKHILKGQDALIVLPTGGGKSLCYQLPALIFDGLSVVVSPLISLMQDQVMQLEQRGIRAAFLNSTLSYSEQQTIMQHVEQGDVKLLYMAPETLVKPGTLLKLDRSNVSCLAIDEAHCISQWGHDFRPDYRALVSIRERFQSAICVALTATATPKVQKDIKKLLKFDEGNEFIGSFNRENLFIAVEPKVELLDQTLAFLRKHQQESGIIYCQTIKQVESLHRDLTTRGISALPYHANLDDEIRKQNQDAFINGEIQVIVATIAFGMGIDKADVRFVLHAGLPKEPESYYQEIGRSGRDGLPADCLLLFSYGDVDTIRYFIDQGAPSEHKDRTVRLNILVDWATSLECRRKGLLAHFGEKYQKQNCGMCDNCRKTEEERVDLTEAAQKFLSGVHRTNQRFGETHIISILLGSMAKKVIRNKHDELPTHGVGKEYNKVQWKNLAQQFLQNELLKRDTQHGNLRLTSKGREVLKGSKKFWGFPVESTDRATSEPKPVYSSVKNSIKTLNTPEPASGKLNEYASELFEQLQDKCRILAKAARKGIFTNRTLEEIATYFPQTKEAFMQIHGVGPKKTERYAKVFLPIIQDYCKKHGIDSAKSEIESPNTHESAFEELNEYSQELFELLQTERDKIYETEGDRVYEAFHDKALQAMATYFPTSEESFTQISSVEPERFNKYADIFLSIIRAYCKEHRIDSTETKTGGLNTNDATSKKRDEYAHDLFEQLQDKCKTLEKAEQEGIFTDRMLREMATSFPRTREAFAQIRGVSLRKTEKYADNFLPIIRAYCEEHKVDSTESISEAPNTHEPISDKPIPDTQELFENLCDKRKVVAAREKLPLHHIFSNKTLEEMVTQLPQSVEAFRKIHRIGRVKTEKYADDFLPIIRAYCKEYRVAAVKKTTKDPNEYDPELFELLQDKCRILAKAERGTVFTNRTLKEMATHLPRTRTAFRRIHGIGTVKTEKYVDDFLPIIQAYCEEHGID